MATCTTLPATDHSTRVLQWVFRRGAESVTCELGLATDDKSYQLCVDPPVNPTGVTIEWFGDAMSAFQRHAAIEHALIQDGWSLESFESRKLEPIGHPAAAR